MTQRRTLTCIAAACLVVVAVVSCGGVSSEAAPSGRDSAPLPASTTVPTTNDTSPATTPMPSPVLPTRTSEPAAAGEFPDELIGTWSGDGNQSLTFTADGSYRSNTSLGEGRATANGGQITLTSNAGNPVVTTWSVSGGRLYLGTSVYLRDDEGSGSLSLVGSWIEADGYALFYFAPDGTYNFSDQARGRASEGTYVVDGQMLTILPSGRQSSTFGLDYDGTYLTFVNPDGTSAGHYVRVG
jgi:hypothetical protein